MKLFLDSCIGRKVKIELINAGHDVVWSGDWDQDPGDEAILATAYSNNRVLVTLDRDFGELAIIRAIPHCGILRLVNLSTRQQPIVCLQVLQLYGNELLSGAIITASLGRVRIRPKDEI